MPHYHHCAKCGVQVSMCSDDTCRTDKKHANYGLHYCSIHHPDPEFHVEPTPPLSRNPAPVQPTAPVATPEPDKRNRWGKTVTTTTKP